MRIVLASALSLTLAACAADPYGTYDYYGGGAYHSYVHTHTVYHDTRPVYVTPPSVVVHKTVNHAPPAVIKTAPRRVVSTAPARVIVRTPAHNPDRGRSVAAPRRDDAKRPPSARPSASGPHRTAERGQADTRARPGPPSRRADSDDRERSGTSGRPSRNGRRF